MNRMRLTNLYSLLLAICLLHGGGIWAQQNLLALPVSIEAKNQRLRVVLDQLSESSGVSFSYSVDVISGNRRISLRAQAQPMAEVLRQLLQGTGTDFKVIGQQIAIFKSPKSTGSTDNLPPASAGESYQARGPSYHLSGYVSEAKSGERLIHATVYDAKTRQGAITNSYGFFSLSLPVDSVVLLVSFAGYEPQRRVFFHDRDRQLSFALENFELETVEIIAEELNRIEEDPLMSQVSLTAAQIKKLPAMMGEQDALKAIQLMPGVQSGSEGTTGLYVRGGGPDQNLILLDGIPLYYVSHLGGLFSIFNPDALRTVSLSKGGFPARYGGRLSSVLDIRMKEGNLRKFEGEGMIGLLTAKLALQGPIVKGKTSFMVSGRRSYFDLISRPLSQAVSDGRDAFGFTYFDFNAKLNHIFSDKDRLYVSVYAGDDRALVRTQSNLLSAPTASRQSIEGEILWGNRLVALRWNHIWSPRLFSNFTATYSNYRFLTSIKTQIETDRDTLAPQSLLARYDSGIRDWSLKGDFDYYLNPRHTLRIGGSLTSHLFVPGITTISGTLIRQDTMIGDFEVPGVETYLYAEDQIDVSRRLHFNLGLHAAAYFVGSEAYFSLEPRLSGRYLLGNRLSLKASFVRMAQFIHLLTNTDASLPVDLWVPATESVPPQRANQVAIGLASSWFRDQLELSVEAYYKRMTDLIEYKEGITFLGNAENWQNKVETGGVGDAYGLEFLLQKNKGKTTGWLGYTLAWNYRQFDQINNGKAFPYRYDRRHDISFTLAHQLSKRVEISCGWVFGTGNAVTLATGKYNSFSLDELVAQPFGAFGGGPQIYLYEGGRNGSRMRSYHRLDWGIDFSKPKKWGQRTWNLSFYNFYNRRNPFFYYFDEQSQPNGQSETTLRQFSLFPIIPSLSYRFEF